MHTISGGNTAALVPSVELPVFSEAVLSDSTMGDRALQKEVIGLFASQFGTPERFFADANDLASWRFAAHSLRGSAAAIGALHVAELAGGMEHDGLPDAVAERQRRVGALAHAVSLYLAAVQHLTS